MTMKNKQKITNRVNKITSDKDEWWWSQVVDYKEDSDETIPIQVSVGPYCHHVHPERRRRVRYGSII